MIRYEVIRKYTPESTRFTQLSRGECVRCIEFSNPEGEWPNWVKCLKEKNEVWIPMQLLDIQNKEGVLLKDYNNTEFDLNPEEILEGHYQLNGWVWCNKEGDSDSVGWAPLNHIKIV